MPATAVVVAAAVAETVACHCCQQLRMLLPQAPAAVSAAAGAVDDADTEAAVTEPLVAGQQSEASRCRAVVQQLDDVAVAAEISLLSFLQRLTNEVQSV